MITFFLNIIKIIFVLGFLILIHEGGHFLIAKLCKVKVNEFSIGFGPVIWRKNGKNTIYTIRLIPLGGFVNLEGEEEQSTKEGSFSEASIPKRIAIVLAGGAVNIIFAILVYFLLVFATGEYTSLKVENVEENYAAQIAQIQPNDEIIEINGEKVKTKSDIDRIISKNNAEKMQVTIKRNGEKKQIELQPTKVQNKSTGIYLKSLNSGESNKIVSVEAKSAAEQAGIKANDQIIKINDIEVTNQKEIIEIIQKEEKIKLVLLRGKEEIQVELIPKIQESYYLGIYFQKADDTFFNRMYYSYYATKDFLFSVLENIKMLFIGNVKVDQLMGPVGISEVVINTSNIQQFVYILALISMSLGITNLLPIPALDGGKLLLLVIEAIRKKKLSQQTEINIQFIGFTLLITLSIYITYHDILRLL